MIKVVKFIAKHCTKEEFIETVLEADVCPGAMSLIPDPENCVIRSNCSECWKCSLKDIDFLQEEKNQIETIMEIDDYKPVFSVIDEATITKEE